MGNADIACASKPNPAPGDDPAIQQLPSRPVATRVIEKQILYFSDFNIDVADWAAEGDEVAGYSAALAQALSKNLLLSLQLRPGCLNSTRP